MVMMVTYSFYTIIWTLSIQNSSNVKKYAFLDVRNVKEWEQGHISGALHIPLGQLPKRLNEIPEEEPIVVYCASGFRSAIAASILQAQGIKDVVNLSGGYNKWKQGAEASV
ncbi:rhodanese-related sulfurtransferase [Bacillus thermophilus]|uniref:Rhodanese-related sulfurtransferase n=2 Tax=Siminovitchia thermophila TaxID=1245522 RepID=A0ABS2RDC8_9BACI|nr:rhodanese-related sulfurtransferase [Siminovitchia thermophila]